MRAGHQAAPFAHDPTLSPYPTLATGLGRKSVACILLLSLGLKDFPVDTNVGRICARLGWIPLDSEQALEVRRAAAMAGSPRPAPHMPQPGIQHEVA